MNIKYFDNFEGLWLDVTGTVGSSLVITNNGFETLQTNKKYLAEITQSGTADATIDFEYFNNIGTIVWSRTNVGEYNGYCLNGFIGNIPSFTKVFFNNSYGSYYYYQITKIDNDNVLLIVTDDTNTKLDERLKNTTIEFSIY